MTEAFLADFFKLLWAPFAWLEIQWRRSSFTVALRVKQVSAYYDASIAQVESLIIQVGRVQDISRQQVFDLVRAIEKDPANASGHAAHLAILQEAVHGLGQRKMELIDNLIRLRWQCALRTSLLKSGLVQG